MDMRYIVIIILTVTAAAFALIKNYKESKTDDVEKEIKKVMQKNRQSYTSGSTPRKTEYTTAPAPVKKAAPLQSDTQPRQKRASANPNKKLLAAVLAMVFISTAAFSVIIFANDYDHDDEQNYFEYEYEQDYCFDDSAMPDSYVPAGYNITGDNKIIDINSITVSIEGFYIDSFQGEGSGEPLIYFSIENNSEKDVSVSFDIIGVNGNCGESWQRTVKSDGSENIICYIFTGADWGIKEIVFGHLTVTDEDSDDYIYGGTDEEYEKLFRFATDSDEEIYTDPWEEKPVYDESGVKIYKSAPILHIENNSKHDFSVNAYALPDNQKTEDTICEKLLLPYGYSMNFELSGDYDMSDMDEGRVSFFLDFECKDTPSESFKTGMIK